MIVVGCKVIFFWGLVWIWPLKRDSEHSWVRKNPTEFSNLENDLSFCFLRELSAFYVWTALFERLKLLYFYSNEYLSQFNMFVYFLGRTATHRCLSSLIIYWVIFYLFFLFALQRSPWLEKFFFYKSSISQCSFTMNFVFLSICHNFFI